MQARVLLCCCLVAIVLAAAGQADGPRPAQECVAVIEQGGKDAVCAVDTRRHDGNDADDTLLLLEGRNVVLVGMMGSGKTTTGRLLAQRLGYEFVDTDDFVEAQLGASIRELFAQGNEQVFRQAEHDALKQLSARSRLVIATGGGAVMREDNWEFLNEGVVVYLSMTAADIVARLRSDAAEIGKRPLLAQHGDPQAALEALLRQREAMYRRAATTVPVAVGDSKEDVLDKVVAAIQRVDVGL